MARPVMPSVFRDIFEVAQVTEVAGKKHSTIFICKLCSSEIKGRGGRTYNLMRHLRRIDPDAHAVAAVDSDVTSSKYKWNSESFENGKNNEDLFFRRKYVSVWKWRFIVLAAIICYAEWWCITDRFLAFVGSMVLPLPAGAYQYKGPKQSQWQSRAPVYDFFKPVEGKERIFKCKICRRCISSKGGTSNLLTHIRKAHPEECEETSSPLVSSAGNSYALRHPASSGSPMSVFRLLDLDWIYESYPKHE